MEKIDRKILKKYIDSVLLYLRSTAIINEIEIRKADYERACKKYCYKKIIKSKAVTGIVGKIINFIRRKTS